MELVGIRVGDMAWASNDNEDKHVDGMITYPRVNERCRILISGRVISTSEVQEVVDTEKGIKFRTLSRWYIFDGEED